MKTTATNRKLRQLLTAINSGHLVPRPDFQRRLVWANKHKIAFIKTVLEQFPFPEIYIASGEVDAETGEGFELLVDGQQRITTLHQYFSASATLKIGKEIPAYAALSADDKLAFLEYEVVVRDLGKMPIEDIKNVFTRINSTNYALNAMEVRNARFEGDLKSFCEKLTQDKFFEKNRIFGSAEIRRMGDLRFVLTLTATLMEGFFDEDDELEPFLDRFNDRFEKANEIRSRLEKTFTFMNSCEFPRRSRVWKKADLFSLIVELDRMLNSEKSVLDPEVVGRNLIPFFVSIDNIAKIESPDSLLVQYYQASIQGTNHRASRVRRGEVLRLLLKLESILDWKDAVHDLGADLVEEMMDWFMERYEDPAHGVPYNSELGGYIYVHGGPYDASEELQEAFPNVPYQLLEKAASRLNDVSYEWAKVGDY